MDDVPVKIAERYKPPPSVYQLPQTIVNRLAQYSPNYYENEHEYQYDFQLERTVLSKCQHWRQMRHQQQQARQGRQEQRKLERQRAVEAKQKEMLGAVDYPSAADLSSDSDDGNDEKVATATTTASPESREQQQEQQQQQTPHEPKSINSCNNFHDILKPTILSGSTVTAPVATLHKRNSSLNYADFEYNLNSTPFDNIELKTINDLDILAQVLHQTQLAQKPQTDIEAVPAEAESTEDDEEKSQLQAKEEKAEAEQAPVTLTTLAETKATLDSVNFQVHCDDAQHIPAMYQPAPIYNTPQQQQQIHTQAQHHVFPHMVYNQHFYPQQGIYPNQNYLPSGYVNGYDTATHLQQAIVPATVNNSLLTPTVNPQDIDTKSRSVPDILRELKSELQQAEKRRTRLHSHNENESQVLAIQQPQLHMSNPSGIFQELAIPAQKLAERISGMGFPLERVAKVVSLCGIDDKKIIEHLIPLGELMDLGFDETKISAALLKFDNNKDKALDYLIK